MTTQATDKNSQAFKTQGAEHLVPEDGKAADKTAKALPTQRVVGLTEQAAGSGVETVEEAGKELVSLTINGYKVTVPKGTTVLSAARKVGVDIPTLCYLRGINEVSACRICLVEVELNGRKYPTLPTACSLEALEGMVVKTNTAAVRKAVKLNLELILANHDDNCLTCIRNGCCELQDLCESFGLREQRFKGGAKHEGKIDKLSASIVRDPNKCILCGRCVSTCQRVQELGVLDFVGRGFETEVGPAFGYSMRDVNCIYCGQCIEACPVGALYERDYIQQVLDAIEDPEMFVVVQTAPAVRASLGEEFGYPIGTPVTGKMVAALRRIGFDRVFDTNFAADLTIMEEGNELIHRLTHGGKIPMITSCSPGWVRFCEMHYPDFLENLSTCKSPQQMMGAVIKSYFAQREGIDPDKILSVSVMPCTSKKTEAIRPEMEVDGRRDIDISLTTRELGRMIRQCGIAFNELPDEQPDSVLGDYTGAGVIFGASGGVMEAALRTAADVLSGTDLPTFEYSAVRGLEGIKESKVTIPTKDGKSIELKLAVASTAKSAGKVLDQIRAGEKHYDFIEIMACPGGCIHGGGQSYVSAKKRLEQDPRPARALALYDEDRRLQFRKSHHNPDIQKLYKDFFGAPLSEKSHHYLHTHYVARETYKQEPHKDPPQGGGAAGKAPKA